MTKTTLSRIGLAIVIFGLMVFVATNLSVAVTATPFAAGNLANPSAPDIAHLLDQLAPDGVLQRGASVDVAVLTKNDGSHVTFTVAEGSFEDSTIDPPVAWSKLLKNPAAIVSSGDEFLSNDGGISRPIGRGCNIRYSGDPIPTGTTVVLPCNGDYVKAFPKIVFVANAVVIAWKGVDETPNCRTDLSTPLNPSQPEYVACVQNAIGNSLTDLFSKQEMNRIDSLVLPALGTGTGGVAKGFFYQSVAAAVAKCLEAVGCGQRLPTRIILAVSSGDRSASGWTATKGAIARNIVSLGDSWRLHYTPDSHVERQARYLGVLLVLFVFVVLLSFQRWLPKTIAQRIALPEGSSLWLLVLGWGIVAAGTFSILSDVMDVFLPSNGAPALQTMGLNIGFGAAAAAGCGLIRKAAVAAGG